MTEDTYPFGDQKKTDEYENLLFTGKQWDFRLASSHNPSEAGVVTTTCGYTAYEDVELYYFNARWYDPETARFITEDPIKDGLLWFAYVNNNPMGFVDPTGMRKKRNGVIDRIKNWFNRNSDNSEASKSETVKRIARHTISLDPQAPIPPVRSPQITRKFDYELIVNGVSYLHKGIDSVGSNRDTLASRKGTVVYSGNDIRSQDNPDFLPNKKLHDQYVATGIRPPKLRGVGKMVATLSESGILALDGHTNPAVNKGDGVNQGDVIGQYDDIGVSLGAHNHRAEVFFTNQDGEIINDPLKITDNMIKVAMNNTGYVPATMGKGPISFTVDGYTGHVIVPFIQP